MAKRISAFIFAGAVLLTGVAMSSPIGGVQEWEEYVSLEPAPFVEDGGDRLHGIQVCAVSVSNKSAVAHTVRLSYYPSQWEKSIEYPQECALAPGASETICFKLLSAGSGSYSSTEVSIDGTPKGCFRDGVSGSFSGRNTSRLIDTPYNVMLSPSLTRAAIENRANLLFGKESKDINWLTGSSNSSTRFRDGKKTVAEWPADWIAYTPADCIVLTREDMAAAPKDVRSALLGYVQAGGRLLLAGFREEEVWRLDLPVGFGEIHAISSSVPQEWTEDDFEVLRDALVTSISQWGVLFKEKCPYPTEAFFPLPPLIAIYAVLFVIMILLGPVLVVVLAKRNMRIRLYWLAPSIAAAVSAVILVVGLARDGVSMKSSAQSVLLLSEAGQAQVQLTTLTMMPPMGLSAPLHFADSTEVTPAPSSQKFSSGRKTVRNYGADGLVLNSAWVPTRVPTTFLLRDVRALDVPLLRFGASATVANPYPVPIRKLLYCDAEGNRFFLEAPLPPGATVALKPCPPLTDTSEILAESVKWTFYDATSFDGILSGFLASPPRANIPFKTYLCELDGTPYLEHPVRKGKVRHEGTTLLMGEL